MRDKLLGLLGIESGEESMVSMLLTQSVFLGIFFGAFDISAHSLFLSIFDEKMMARGYVVSGIAGIILTSVYTWLQSNLKFKNFSVANLIAVTSFTLLLWIALLLSPSKWIVFLVFIMLGPLNILAALGFWGTAGRLFTLRQGKRLFGLVDSGLILGIIISCYTIPVLLSLNFDSHNILLISALSILIASAIQIFIGSRFLPATIKESNKAEGEKKSVLSLFRKDRYTRIMALFIALSVVTAFFVQYSFMAVTREQYPAEEDMARFLGIFTGSMMIFTLLVKLLAFSYLIRNYGLKTCLAISPVLVAFFTAVAIFIGISMGYTPQSISGFLIFFLVMALSRLFSKSLKDSIESPSFKVIYQTIGEKMRYEVQSGMDGTVNEIAALSSGLLLAGLGVLSFIKLIHFSFVLFFIILSWILVAFMLYSEYRKSIRKALEAVDIQVDNITAEDQAGKNWFSAEISFRNDYFKLITGDFNSLEKNRNQGYYEKLIDFSTLKNDLNLIPAMQKIAEDNEIDESIRKKSEICIGKIRKSVSSGKPGNEKSESAMKLLSGGRVPKPTEVLRLLRDSSTESKKLAVYMIGKFKLSDMLTEVCECLNIPCLETDASAVLSSFGDMASTAMIRFYGSSSGSIHTSRAILILLGRIRNEESTQFLFTQLWSNSRILKEIAAKCLIEVDFKPSDEEKDRLHQLISEIAGLMTWNLSARVCLEKNNDDYLLQILNKDISRWKTFLFNVMSVTYDSAAIKKIKENLENDTVESGNFALEMIDIVIDEAIKPKIIALLDFISDEEKLKNLWHFFPGEIPQYDKLLEDIVNRDYNMIDLWTKACALRSLQNIKGSRMAESASALLFSPEDILQQEAAKLIARSDKNLYRSVSQRIPNATRERLDRIIDGRTDTAELVFEKIQFLTKCFAEVPAHELILLSETMVYVADVKSGFSASGDCIIWPLPKQDNGNEVYIHHQKAQDHFYTPDGNSRCYFLPLSSVVEFRNHFPERSAEIINYIDKNIE